MIKVCIVDDHQLVIDGIKTFLAEASDLQCVAEAHNGEEAIAVVKEKEIDVILMDINMPELNGIEATKAIRKFNKEVKIVALSMLQEVSLIKLMLKNGANGYLVKNEGRTEIIEAVRKVHAGKAYYSNEVSEIIMASFTGAQIKTVQSPFPKLSPREKEVLELIVEEYTTGEIAEKLFISFGTVETHRRNLLSKLGARNTAGLVRACLEYDLLAKD